MLPAVVSITAPATEGPATEREGRDEPMRGLLGELLGEGRRQPVAAGLIIHPSGLVVTAAHTIDDGQPAGEIPGMEAVTAEGVAHRVELVGVDRKTRIALIRLVGRGAFPHVALGDSASARVGDRALAVGAPYGLGSTATAGIISALPRRRPAAMVDELIQTDAATFPESSGGPLVDDRGSVIGLVTVLTAEDFGISFALPSNVVQKVVTQLARDGIVKRGALGARVQRLTPGLTRALATPTSAGLLVAELSSDGAAAKAGLHPGDVLTEVDGRPLEAVYDLDRALRDSSPGQAMQFVRWRKGERQVSRVVLGGDTEKPPVVRPLSSRAASMLGFDVRPVAHDIGVVVSHVRPDDRFDEPPLRPADVILEIDQHVVKTMADFDRLVDGIKSGQWLAFRVQRGRAAIYVAVEARDGSRVYATGLPR